MKINVPNKISSKYIKQQLNNHGEKQTDATANFSIALSVGDIGSRQNQAIKKI